MKKNTMIAIIIILIILGLIIGGGYLFFQKNIKVGDAYFSLPDGYECIANGKYANITNDNESYIIIQNYDTNDIDNVTKDYVNYNKEHNITINITKVKAGDYTVYKSAMKSNPDIVHYWYVYNNKVYEIYTRSANSQIDDIINNMIQTTQAAII